MPISLSGSLLITGSLTASGTLTAQTLVVQTVTSSIVYSSGSNIFGNSSTDTQKFTGSVLVTGSSTFNGVLTAGATTLNGNLNLQAGAVRNINFYDSSNTNINAQIQYDQLSSTSGQLFFGTNNAGTFATRLTIGSTGTATFSSDIQGGGDLYFNKGSRTTIYPTTTNQNLHMKSNGSGVLQFNNDNSGNLTMCVGGGNVGIGMTSTRTLGVESSNASTTFFHNSKNTSGDRIATWQLGGSNTNNASSYYLFCDTDNVGVLMVIYGTGNLANVNNSYGAYSDIKLKENITDATPKLDDLLKVKIRNFNLKGSNIKQIGVVAQELEEVFPSMIEESNDTVKDENGEHIENGEKTKTVKYSVFVPMLIKAIQEQQSQIESQNTLIQELTTRLTALENR